MVSKAVLLAVICNVLFALIFNSVIHRKCRYLHFPATRRSTSLGEKTMMANVLLKSSKSNSLTTQIKHAERQVLNRKQDVCVSAETLVKNIHHQMTAPTTLLLACGMGFVLGEITKPQNPNSSDTAGKTGTAEISPPATALNLGLLNQKNGLSHDTHGALVVSGL